MVGLVGNGLVILVIARFAKMKTVTNIFILNLSIADGLFLLGLPMAMTTSLLKHWIFGEVLCKTYYTLTTINQFTGAFTLTMMSADRFLAVRYPLSSMNIRTPCYALVSILVIWVTSLLFMIPVILFAELIVRKPYESCQMVWPSAHAQIGQKIFLIYTLLLGFAIPVFVITCLYSLIVLKLKRTSPSLGVSAKKRSHATKVTKLVTVIISVFILCWLPYWLFQAYLIKSIPLTKQLHPYLVYLFQACTILSYANSMVNPILYAFTNENFREAFRNAFACADDSALAKTTNTRRRSSECASVVVSAKKAYQSLSPIVTTVNGNKKDIGLVDVALNSSSPSKVSNSDIVCNGESDKHMDESDCNQVLLTN